MPRLHCTRPARVVIATLLLVGTTFAADKTNTIGPNRAKWLKVRTRAVNFLKSAQDDDGSWTSPRAAVFLGERFEVGEAAGDNGVVGLQTAVQQRGGGQRGETGGLG